MKTFYSNGKLLLTAEYLVLDGAQALAVPTVFGQSMDITPTFDNILHWTSYDADGSIWYESHISKSDILAKRNDFENAISNTLIEILHYANQENPAVLNAISGFKVSTKLTFPRQWGLGTSSTLINNIAQWFQIDAFQLLQTAFGGSGYDIACAQNNTPILYKRIKKKPYVMPISFQPHFIDKLYFVYLNQKQNSKTAIANYKKSGLITRDKIDVISQLTAVISSTQDFTIFCQSLEQHEEELAAILKTPTIKEALFNDFTGTIKSLGAWGGDFVMVATAMNPTAYFEKKGYSVVIPYSEMILAL